MTNEFKYREIDEEGWETLDVIAEAKKFNRWMYKTILPFCTGHILEIGSGIGNISGQFIDDKRQITLTDIRANYCEVLKKKFPTVEVFQLDLVHPDFDNAYAEHLNRYDTMFALNVVEHIENDSLALKNCYKLLKPGGKCVILVPAYQALYNRFDEELEHYRRYNRKSLNGLLSGAGFRVDHSRHFNFMGIPGWYLSGRLQKNKTIPKGQMKLYNLLVPVFRLVDKILFNKVGLSVISIGAKAS